MSKVNYHNQIKSVWQRAASELKDCQYLIIIGYSFPKTDEFFKYWFALSKLDGETFRKIIIVNPDPNAKENFNAITKDRIGSGNVEFINKGFSESLKDSGNDNLTYHLDLQVVKKYSGVKGFV